MLLLDRFLRALNRIPLEEYWCSICTVLGNFQQGHASIAVLRPLSCVCAELHWLGNLLASHVRCGCLGSSQLYKRRHQQELGGVHSQRRLSMGCFSNP